MLPHPGPKGKAIGAGKTRRGPDFHLRALAASVAVFTQNPTEAPVMPGGAFAKVSRLSGGELRVLLALARGVAAKEAADILGISEPTVRTHLQRMFSKTGTTRQAELP
jgi:DNA-binding CsgD family transcriptional regulator